MRTSDKGSLVARYFISLQPVNKNYLTDFDTTDLHNLKIGFHAIDISADRRPVWNTNYLQKDHVFFHKELLGTLKNHDFWQKS